MPDRMKISDDLIVGAQPSEAELKAMSEDGVKTVINLRAAGEDMQPMSPDKEGHKVKEHGMAYVHLPVSMKEAGPETVDDFRKKLQKAKRPVFVHCKLGKRAGAFVMMDQAVREGWSGKETLKKAEEMGFECDNAKMEDFVRKYVDSRAKE